MYIIKDDEFSESYLTTIGVDFVNNLSLID